MTEESEAAAMRGEAGAEVMTVNRTAAVGTSVTAEVATDNERPAGNAAAAVAAGV
eukprot:COSAG05_NODE_1254_length_5375_cov_10.078658_2_plen_55_part_00